MKIKLLIWGCLLSFAIKLQAQNPDVDKANQIVAHMRNGQYAAISSMMSPQAALIFTMPVLKQIREVMSLRNSGVNTGDFTGLTDKDDDVLKAEIKFTNFNPSINLVCVFNNQHQLTQIYLEPRSYGRGKYKDAAYADSSLCEQKQILVQTSEFILPGTLTIPKGKKNYPVLVFVHGSGNSDRDEALFSLKPFRDIALGLAAQGIASLRYDKRNKVYNAADVHDGRLLTMEDETTDDAASAIRLALALPHVSRVFVIGHSQGGMMIPQIVSENPKLAGAIIMSGPAISLLQSYENQYRTVQLDEAVRKAALNDIEQIKHADTISNQTRILLNKPSYFWTNLQPYKQLEVVKTIKQPLLILQGGRDYQVSPADAGKWQSAAKGSKDVTVKIYAKLNHFYTEGIGPSTSNEYFTPGNVPAYVVNDIAAWITKH